MSEQYGTPDWVNPANTPAPAVSEVPVDPGVTSPTGTGGQNGQGHNSSKHLCFLSMMSILNIGLATLMTALGVLTILHIHNLQADETYIISEPFLAFYMILFAVLLFMYEMMYWSPLEKLNNNMRKNFGFLYGLRGKGFYLIFCGCLCFGLGKDASVKVLNYVTGISWLLGGIFHVFVTCSKPEVAADYAPPAFRSSKAGFGEAPLDENAV